MFFFFTNQEVCHSQAHIYSSSTTCRTNNQVSTAPKIRLFQHQVCTITWQIRDTRAKRKLRIFGKPRACVYLWILYLSIKIWEGKIYSKKFFSKKKMKKNYMIRSRLGQLPYLIEARKSRLFADFMLKKKKDSGWEKSERRLLKYWQRLFASILQSSCWVSLSICLLHIFLLFLFHKA